MQKDLYLQNQCKRIYINYMNTKTLYYILLVDIINLTQLPFKDFDLMMNLLETKLNDINIDYKKDLVLPLSINYGDEIAGLFYTPENIFNVVDQIRGILAPLTNIRFVVVKGKIGRASTDIRKIGGVIFKVANEAIEELKKNDRLCSWLIGNDPIDKTLEVLCEICKVIKGDMSDYQREVYELLKKGLSQKQIAVKLNKYTQSVWDAIQRSKANYIIEAEKTVNLILTDEKLFR
jgi:hypothetical protein